MKKLLLLIPVSMIICACPDRGDSIDYNYTIENKSDKIVTIIPYLSGAPDLPNSIILQPNAIINKKYTYTPPGGAGYSMANLLPQNSGYVAFSFNNEKVNLYSIYSAQCTSCPPVNSVSFPIIYNENSRNVFNIQFSNDVTETYTITHEDFQNATDCGGNCY